MLLSDKKLKRNLIRVWRKFRETTEKFVILQFLRNVKTKMVSFTQVAVFVK